MSDEYQEKQKRSQSRKKLTKSKNGFLSRQSLYKIYRSCKQQGSYDQIVQLGTSLSAYPTFFFFFASLLLSSKSSASSKLVRWESGLMG